MNTFIAYITGNDGIPRRFAMLAFDMGDARREALLLAQSMFRSFSYSVIES